MSQDKQSDLGELEEAAPSVTSTTARKRKEKEVKQATIRQHYYPEGGWGYVVVAVTFLVQVVNRALINAERSLANKVY